MRMRKNMHSRKKWLVHRRYDRVVRGSSAHRHERAMERPGQACQPVRVFTYELASGIDPRSAKEMDRARRRSGMSQSAEPLAGYSGCKLIDCKKRNGPHWCADLFRAVPSQGLGNCLLCIAPRLPAEVAASGCVQQQIGLFQVADYSSAPIRWLAQSDPDPPRQRAPAMNSRR